MRDFHFRNLKQTLEEDGEESFKKRVEGHVSGYLEGYLEGLMAEHCFVYGEELFSSEDIQDIVLGISSSNSFVRRIPDNFTEDFPLNNILDATIDYINRWFMYKELFSDEKYTEN